MLQSARSIFTDKGELEHMIKRGAVCKGGMLVGIALVTSGCAGYSITHGGTGSGYDVYRPDPYLLVKPADKGGMTGEIVWLPNYSERYRIRTWNFLGKADFQFDMTDGWQLTKISDKSDNTSIASKLLDVVQKATKPDTISLTTQVQLYRLVYNEKGEFTGLKLMPFGQ